MKTADLVEAKARVSELVARTAAGERVRILRRGKGVAQSAPVPSAAKPIDIEALTAPTHRMPMTHGTGTLMRGVRDAARR